MGRNRADIVGKEIGGVKRQDDAFIVYTRVRRRGKIERTPASIWRFPSLLKRAQPGDNTQTYLCARRKKNFGFLL